MRTLDPAKARLLELEEARAECLRQAQRAERARAACVAICREAVDKLRKHGDADRLLAIADMANEAAGKLILRDE